MARPFEREPNKIQQAQAWLSAAMGGQECKAADLEQRAPFSHGTLYEARRRSRIKAEKRKAGWYWLPPRARKSP